VFGVIDDSYVNSVNGTMKSLSVYYQGFNSNICDSLNITQQNSCYKQGNDFYVVTQNLYSGSDKIFLNWKGLTAKLRLE